MIVASMASLSSRSELLERTIASLEPQVDAICVYLNGYPRVPDFLRRPKVLHAVLSLEAGWRGAEAKLWFWDRSEFRAAPRWDFSDVALICDDDLIYPGDYARRMIGALDARPGSVACVHGSIMTRPFERYVTSRMVARTAATLGQTTQVHIPGTGTMAFRYGDVADVLDGALRRFTWSHSVDPHVAVMMHEAKIPIWSVLRPPRWIVPQSLPAEGTAIFPTRTGAGSDYHETLMLKTADERRRFPELAVHSDMTARILQVNRSVLAPPRRRVTANPNPHSMLPAEALDFLSRRFADMPAGVVVELGSGHGTKNLLDRLPSHLELVSVEHDPDFVGLVEEASYLYAPIHNGWYDVRVLANKLTGLPGPIVAVIVDGPPSKIGRARLAKHLDLFPPGVPMLVDDVHRQPELELAKQIASSRKQAADVHRCPGRAFATIGWS